MPRPARLAVLIACLAAAALAALGRGLAWGLAVLAVGWLAALGPDLALPAGQADHYGYGRGLALFGVVLGSVVVAVIGVIVAVAVGRGVHHSMTVSTRRRRW